jgi:hypothetical protein
VTLISNCEKVLLQERNVGSKLHEAAKFLSIPVGVTSFVVFLGFMIFLSPGS